MSDDLPDIDPVDSNEKPEALPTPSLPPSKKTVIKEMEEMTDRIIKIVSKLPEGKDLAKEIVYSILVNTLTPEEICYYSDTIKFNIHLGDEEEEEPAAQEET